MKVLVTGATGLVGSHIALRHLAAGDDVRALVRPRSDAGFLRQRGVEIVSGDMTDPSSLQAAVRGIDVVHHNAAVVSDWGSWSEFQEVGECGTQHLLDAVWAAQVPRVVHMSTVGVYALLRIHHRHVTEDFPLPRFCGPWDYYGRSKIVTEKLFETSAKAGRIRAVILRPTIVYGERDRVALPRLASLLTRGRLPLLGSGANRMHLIYAGDVAEGAFLAATEPCAEGRIYHLDGPPDVTQSLFFHSIAALVGAPPPQKHRSLYMSYGRAFGAEAIARLSGSPEPPDLTRYLVAMCGGESQFDTTRAERDLGWKPQYSFAEGWERTARWWSEQTA